MTNITFTSDRLGNFTGSAAPNNLVTLKKTSDNTTVGTATPNASGSWTLTLTGYTGTQSFYATQAQTSVSAGRETYKESAVAGTYYIDSINGDDTKAGDKPSTAWKTLAKANGSNLGSNAIVLFRRGSNWSESFALKSTMSMNAYGRSVDSKPIIGTGQTFGMNLASISNANVRNIAFVGLQRDVSWSTFTNVLFEDCDFLPNTNIANTQGLYIRNGTGLIVRRCYFGAIYGDSIYCDKNNNTLFEDNVFVPGAGGSAADSLQIRSDNFGESSGHIVRRNNMNNKTVTSNKGAFVSGRVSNLVIEANSLTGNYFGGSLPSNGMVFRGDDCFSANLNNNSFGFGIGEQWVILGHQAYNNISRESYTGMLLSGFNGQPDRGDVEWQYNVVQDNTQGFKLDRPWTGRVRRNVFRRNGTNFIITGQGATFATNGVLYTDNNAATLATDNYINTGDGPANTIKPHISGMVQEGSTLTVDNGTWTGTATITYTRQWLKNGRDISGATGTTYVIPAGFATAEISCVTIAVDGNGDTMIQFGRFSDGSFYKAVAITGGFNSDFNGDFS